MRQTMLAVSAIALVTAGCATYAWHRPDTPTDVVAHDEAACYDIARDATRDVPVSAFPRLLPPPRPWSPFWWSDPYWGPMDDPLWRMQTEQRIRDDCMRGRGYDLQRVPKA